MFEALLTLIFFRPFVSSLTFLVFAYENLAYSILLLGFLVFWILIKGINFKQVAPIKYPLILFPLALLISLMFSQDKIISVKELYKYVTGISLLLVSASLTCKDRRRLILCIVICGFLVSLFAIYQYFFGFQRLLEYITAQGIRDPFVLDYVSRKRVFFPFVTPNILGGYLAMIIPLALIHKNTNWLIIPLSLALLLTRSLGGLLSLFLGLAIYFYLRGGSRKKGVLILSGLLIIIALIVAARTSASKQHIQPIFSGMMRWEYWKDTLKIIKAAPLTGVGLGNFNLPQARYAHNSYLQIWAEMGFLGILSFLWLIAAAYKSALNNYGRISDKNMIAGLLCASAVFLIHNIMDFTFFLPETAFIWWIITGCLFSFHSQSQK
ncbi:MAG: O-antigen ligase family protein [Candidatus Omnitrophota bacterium]